MTIEPPREELARRWIYAPQPGSIHINDLINKAKDGISVKDKVSDYVVGMLWYSRFHGDIKYWEGDLFQLPFVLGMKRRKKYGNYGHPFLGPDGKILAIQGIVLHGERGRAEFELSDLTIETLYEHPNFEKWVVKNIYSGRNNEYTSYIRKYTYNSKADCDYHINFQPNGNERPYCHGPKDTYPPGATIPGLHRPAANIRFSGAVIAGNESGNADTAKIRPSVMHTRRKSDLTDIASLMSNASSTEKKRKHSESSSTNRGSKKVGIETEISQVLMDPPLSCGPNISRIESNSGIEIKPETIEEPTTYRLTSYRTQNLAARGKEFDEQRSRSLALTAKEFDDHKVQVLAAKAKELEEQRLQVLAATEEQLDEEKKKALSAAEKKMNENRERYFAEEEKLFMQYIN